MLLKNSTTLHAYEHTSHWWKISVQLVYIQLQMNNS